MSKWYGMNGAAWAAGNISSFALFVESDTVREIHGSGDYGHYKQKLSSAQAKFVDSVKEMFYDCTRTDCPFRGDIQACRNHVGKLLISSTARKSFHNRAKLMRARGQDLLCDDAVAPGTIPSSKWS